MSLARALTRRYKADQQPEIAVQVPLARASTLKRLDKPIDRSQISLPIELISSTNVMAYEAPDIHPVDHPQSPLSAPSSADSFKSYDDSDHARSSASSMTSADISRESSPTIAEPKKSSSYFSSHTTSALSAQETLQAATYQQKVGPSLPQRAPSHTKKTHQALAHKRSMRLTQKSNDEAAATPAPLSPAKSSKPSIELHPSDPHTQPTENPFGAELAQVKEVAEEFGVRDVQIWDEEEQWILDNGLGRYAVEEYINEIQPLFSHAFSDTVYSPTWL
ncbi:hypothetical protein MMC10_009513 [Thelotrema lepadinum]|nr:hypothetical protein [Thelotrema lepadinum]